MNRKFLSAALFLTIFVICNGVYCQKILSGKVVDLQTTEPIPFVHIFNENKGIGTTTNINGEFNMIIPDSLKELDLIFSHVGYVLFTSTLKPQEPASISLTPSDILLEEIVVSPVDPFEILKKCIDQSSFNYPDDDFKSTGFQREVITSDKEYVQLVETQYETYIKQGVKKTKILNGRFAENKALRIRDNLWNDKNGGFYVFGITALGDLNAPFRKSILGLDPKDFNQISKFYNLNYAGRVDLGTGESFVIQFHPKENIKKPLIQGTMYIDSESFALVEIEYKLADVNKKHLKINRNWQGDQISTAPLFKKIQILDESRVIKYRPNAGKWFLSSIVQDMEFTATVKLPLKTIAKSTILNLHLEQVVSSIEQGIFPYSDENAPTDMYYYQVYLKNNSENYDAKAWKQFRSIKGEVDFAEVVNVLKEKNETIKLGSQ
jgi:hypothetical protein